MAEVANGELARRLRAAARALILERGAPSVRFQHVRAHMGEPGNETADALTKAAVEQARMCGATRSFCPLCPGRVRAGN